MKTIVQVASGQQLLRHGHLATEYRDQAVPLAIDVFGEERTRACIGGVGEMRPTRRTNCHLIEERLQIKVCWSASTEGGGVFGRRSLHHKVESRHKTPRRVLLRVNVLTPGA